MKGKFTITYDPMPGSTITDCIAECIAMANKAGLSVQLRQFNGVDLNVAPGATADACYDEWEIVFNNNAKLYRNSPECQKAAADSQRRADNARREVRRLLGTFDESSRSLDTLVGWAKDFSVHADNNAVVFDKDALADMLENLGYRNNMHVAKEGEIRPKWMKKIMGEYIIGQVINCLRNGMPPHPIEAKFADEYAAMTETPRDEQG